MHQMTEELRCELMDFILDDVYALLKTYVESGNENAFRAVYEEWEEYLLAADHEPLDVTWVYNINAEV